MLDELGLADVPGDAGSKLANIQLVELYRAFQAAQMSAAARTSAGRVEGPIVLDVSIAEDGSIVTAQARSLGLNGQRDPCKGDDLLGDCASMMGSYGAAAVKRMTMIVDLSQLGSLLALLALWIAPLDRRMRQGIALSGIGAIAVAIGAGRFEWEWGRTISPGWSIGSIVSAVGMGALTISMLTIFTRVAGGHGLMRREHDASVGSDVP